MMNKVIRIFCNENDKEAVEKTIESYTKKDGSMINIHDGSVRILFNCSILKVKNLKHDLELLNNIGISAEIR